MENSMLNRWPIDPAIVIISLGTITLLLLIMTIICILQTNKLYRRYDKFMRGKDAESLEKTIMGIVEENKELRLQDKNTKDAVKVLSKRIISKIWYGKI